MFKQFSFGIFSFVLSIALLLEQPAVADSKKPTILKPCMQCHEDEPGYLRGRLKSVSRKAKTFQVFMGLTSWQLTFDNNTELNGAKKVNKIGKNKEIGVAFEQRGKVLVATAIDVKQPADIPQSWVITTEEMTRLVAMGPKAGNFSLFDARPGKVFHESHIPGAISNYDAQFDKNLHKLPKNKNKLLIFYCGGPT